MKTRFLVAAVALALGALEVACAVSGDQDIGPADPQLNPQPLPPIDNNDGKPRESSSSSSGGSDQNGDPTVGGAAGAPNNAPGVPPPPNDPDAGTGSPCKSPGLC